MELKKTSKTDLQNKKTLFFELGLSLSLLTVLLAFNWSSKERDTSVLVAEYQGIIEEEEQVPITLPEAPLPELPKIPQIPDIIEIVDDDVDITSTFDLSLENDNQPQTWNYLETKPPVIPENKDVDEVLPFVMVEVKPMFQGKDAGEFVKWIYARLQGNYPQAAQENNIQGTVRVSFTVNVDGSL
ncbi:MAG: energy transducer TonB, partial [Prevotellaceae bacterium]|nr:energy transducer TonB [Prevotellaceae bacterium]